MELKFLNDPKGLEPLIRETLDSLLHFNPWPLPLAIDIDFKSDPLPLFDGEVAAAGADGDMNGWISFRNDAPLFDAPVTRGRTDEEKMRFFREVVIHELAHVLAFSLPPPKLDELGAMFGYPPEEWSSEEGPWEGRPPEGLAETFKDAFLPRSLRLFANRTNIHLPIHKYPEFRAFWRNISFPIEGEESVGGYFGWDKTGVGTYRKVLVEGMVGDDLPTTEFPLSIAAEVAGAQPIPASENPTFRRTTGGLGTDTMVNLPNHPNTPARGYLTMKGVKDRAMWIWRGHSVSVPYSQMALVGGKHPIRWKTQLSPRYAPTNRMAGHLRSDVAATCGQEYWWWRWGEVTGWNPWFIWSRPMYPGSHFYEQRDRYNGDPTEIVPLGTKLRPVCKTRLYPVWEKGGAYSSGAPAEISLDLEFTAISALPVLSGFDGYLDRGRIAWEYTGTDPAPYPWDPSEIDGSNYYPRALVGFYPPGQWNLSDPHYTLGRIISHDREWDPPAEGADRLAGVLIAQWFEAKADGFRPVSITQSGGVASAGNLYNMEGAGDDPTHPLTEANTSYWPGAAYNTVDYWNFLNFSGEPYTLPRLSYARRSGSAHGGVPYMQWEEV